MKTNQAGLKLIEDFEGLFLKAYQTKIAEGVYDVPTIGYGHTTAAGPPIVNMGMVITKAEAEAILQADLKKVEAEVSRLVTVPLTDNQFASLVSWTFNLGSGNLKKSSLLRRLNTGDYNIGEEFLKWDKAQGVTLKGLVRRRKAEKVLWESDAVSVTPIPMPVPHPVPIPVPVPVPVPRPQQSAWFVSILELVKSIFMSIFGRK